MSQLEGLAGKGDYFQGWQLLLNVQSLHVEKKPDSLNLPTDLLLYTGMYIHIHTANNQISKQIKREYQIFVWLGVFGFRDRVSL